MWKCFKAGSEFKEQLYNKHASMYMEILFLFKIAFIDVLQGIVLI